MMDADKLNAAELQNMCYPTANPQQQLNYALHDKNLAQFQHALEQGADPNRISPKGDDTLSVFEFCCQESSHAAFIEECLKWGCDVNKVNESFGAMPVNFAAESEDVGNLAVVLANARVSIDHQYEGKTPLSQLCDGINDENYACRLPCIQLLLEHLANVNIGNEIGKPPILMLLEADMLSVENKRSAVQLLLRLAAVDVDTHWEGAARKLLQTNFPDVQVAAPLNEAERAWYDDRLLDALRSGNEELFLRGCDARMLAKTLADFLANCALPTNDQNPMKLAIDYGLERVLEKLLRCGATVTLLDSGFNAIRLASRSGQHRILNLLISASTASPALVASVSRALVNTVPEIGNNVSKSDRVDHGKCVEHLLAVRGIDLNWADEMGNTALHMAVRYKQHAAVRELLRRGARMGTRNAFGTIAMADIDADVLAAHLDECIGESGVHRPGDDEYQLCLNYANFEPAAINAKQRSGRAAKYSTNEMTPIAHIVAARDLQHLAKHPLIASFLYLKWLRLAPVFYANFACHAVFCISLIAHILCRNSAVAPTLRPLLGLFVTCGIAYIVVREMCKLVVGPAYFVRNGATYLAAVLVLLSAVLLIDDVASGTDGEWLPETTRRTLAAIAILLSVGEFFVLLGSLPVLSFSTHLVMLLTVTRSFLKSLLLYSIMLVAFALCFCTLLGRDAKDPVKEGKSVEEQSADAGDDDGEFNKFVSPGLAIVKTVVMLTGEFDAGSIDFAQNGFSYFVFVVFVFLVSTVLFNLLNGLAVNDTAVIKSDAELTNLIYRAKLLAKYELILGQGNGGCCNALLKKVMSKRINIFPDYLPCAAINVLPNDNNRVQISDVTDNEAGYHRADHTDDLQNFARQWTKLPCCFRFARMEPRIVKSARAVLDQRLRVRDVETEVKDRDALLERRLAQIERNVEAIVQRLDRVLAPVNN